MNKIIDAGKEAVIGIISFFSIILKGVLALLFLIVSNVTFAQEIRLEASLDTAEILIGDQVKFQFDIDVPPGSNVKFPVLSDTITAGVEILNTSAVDTGSMDNDKMKLSQEILLTSFDSGYYKIPSFPFVVVTPRLKDTLFSSPVFLAVHTLEVDTTKAIFDIKAPYSAPFTFREALPYILIFIGLVALGFGILFFIKKRKNNEPVFKSSKLMQPPHELALDELDKLDKEKLWQQGKVKIYYVRLTEIIRNYIEDRFHVPAMEQITEEIMDGMKVHYPTDDPVMVKLNQILELSDLAKFAKFLPTPGENKLAMEHAYSFVLATKPAEIARDNKNDDTQIKNAGTKTEA